MEAARQAIADRFGIDRWTVFPDSEVCAGCRFLDGRAFFAFEGPRPRLHYGCRCSRQPVDTAGMSGVALIRLVLEAQANGRQARFLEEEAKRLSEEDHTNRVLLELAERDPTYVPILEAWRSQRREAGGQ